MVLWKGFIVNVLLSLNLEIYTCWIILLLQVGSWHILTAPYGNNIHFQVLHHMLSLISIVYAMYSGEGQLYTYMVLISETTTPGINLRWYVMKRICTVFLSYSLLNASDLFCHQGSLIPLDWKNPRPILSMVLRCLLHGWYVTTT